MVKRKHRTSAEWQDLIEQQQNSGLNGSAFCKQHRLCKKVFYARRKELGAKAEAIRSTSGQFVQIKPVIDQPAVVSAAPVLFYRDSRLQLPSNIDTTWVASLMKALS